MARPQRQTHQFSGKINQVVWDKLQSVKEELGIAYDVAAIEWCIIQVYEDRNKPYMQAAKNRPPRETDPQKKAQNYIEDQKAREEAIRKDVVSRGMEIAKVLGGRVIDHGNGFYSCEYSTYDLSTPHYVNIGKLTIPFEQLDEKNIINQFKTSLPGITNVKETIVEVLKTQQNG